MDDPILLLGGGGHCKSVLCSILSSRSFDKIGIVDRVPGGEMFGIPVVGGDEDLGRLRNTYSHAFITLGGIGDVGPRRRLFMLAQQAGFRFPNIIDSTAAVSPFAELGEGIFIGKNAVVNASARIHDCVILNTGSIVEHDDIVHDFAHIAPGAVLGGMVSVGADTHIGSNTTVLQGIRIGAGSIIGAGSVVTKDMPQGIVAYGNPCREVRNVDHNHC